MYYAILLKLIFFAEFLLFFFFISVKSLPVQTQEKKYDRFDMKKSYVRYHQICQCQTINKFSFYYIFFLLKIFLTFKIWSKKKTDSDFFSVFLGPHPIRNTRFTRKLLSGKKIDIYIFCISYGAIDQKLNTGHVVLRDLVTLT